MATLTAFQVRCEEAFQEFLRKRGMRLRSRKVVGDRETYIHASVEGEDVEVWIYDDEAEYRAGTTRRNFEAAVFRDETRRIDSFIKAIQKEFAP